MEAEVFAKDGFLTGGDFGDGGSGHYRETVTRGHTNLCK